MIEFDTLYKNLGEFLSHYTFTIPSLKQKKSPQMTLPKLVVDKLRRKYGIDDIPMRLLVFEHGLILVADEEQIKAHQKIWEDWRERKRSKKKKKVYRKRSE